MKLQVSIDDEVLKDMAEEVAQDSGKSVNLDAIKDQLQADLESWLDDKLKTDDYDVAFHMMWDINIGRPRPI